MKFLVIGSNSFSGSHFVELLNKNGVENRGASRSELAHPAFLPKSLHGNWSKNNFLKVDLNHDGETLWELLQEFRPTHVVNFAAQSMVGESWQRPEDWYQTNVVSISRLVKMLSRLESLEKYVHISTPEVYGSSSTWINEGARFEPSTPYAVSRASSEMHLRIMHREFGFPFVSTRAANVFGPGQQLYRLIPKAFLSSLLSQSFDLHGGGTSKRAFVNITDVAKATMLVATNGKAGETYHVSPQETISIRDMVERVFDMTGSNASSSLRYAEDRPGKDDGYFLDSTKIRTNLGWQEEKSLDEGLSEVEFWIRENLEVFKDMEWSYEHKR